MLPAAYNWIECEAGLFLRFNYRLVASVRPDDFRFEVKISWRGKEHRGDAASLAQGKRFIERWVGVQKGLPSCR